MPWLTFDAPNGYCKLTLIVPNDENAIAAINGGIKDLLEPYNWEQFGELTPDECSQLMYTPIIYQYYECRVMIAGDDQKVLIDDNGSWIFAD